MLGTVVQCSPQTLDHLKNFAIVFLAQLIVALVQALPGVPSIEQLYAIVITSLSVTVVFFGYNKVTANKEAKAGEPAQ